ncbi:hypothetical protein QR680_005886 [Steinernema hermaphroditum]|uniref:BPTI/Kunitz inhibitor domain-containing protein n=1 Tax=Steinernema hermaphroditum TaxID=289476 RepID=A0AA39HV13_9BILA|nr:hypothetical protein QR680_005886 [Steinernema hermaphroditum]
MRSLLIVAIFAVVVFCRRLPEEDEIGGPIPLCSDGKGALLEAGRVYRCSQACPEGFFCEYRDEAKTPERGICCPDLEKLYELYGTENGPDAKVMEIELRRKGANKSGENRTRSGELNGREEIVVDLSKLDEAEGEEPLNPTKEAESNATTTDYDPIPTPAPLKIPVEASKTEVEKAYSCRRHSFKFTCKNGTVPTQFVLRWHAKDGRCSSYPYGFCPGTLIVDDNKIRTKTDCEEYCLDATSKDGPITGDRSKEAGDPSDPSSKTLKDEEQYEELRKKACERFAPYRDTCPDTKLPSQFVLRWYAKNGKCCSYPYGYCHGETVSSENLIRTKEACEKHCINSEPVTKETTIF